MGFFELLLCLALIFGPIVGYVPQYKDIWTSQDPGGFSPLVCFILIAANILRVFFWLLKGFELSLLYQSIVMIVAQLVLLELIVRVQLKGRPSFSMNKFWQWDYFGEYLAFLGVFFTSLAALTILNKLILGSSWITELIGGMALLIESTLAMPQFYQNWKTKTNGGLRPELLGAWFLGDAFKTLFFISRGSPAQFIACGAVQLLVDCGIGYQMYAYPSGEVGTKGKRLIVPSSLL